jgi:adenine-specific DNA-methyltransferase
MLISTFDKSIVDNKIPQRALVYPLLRYMGSKNKLLPWIYDELTKLSFKSVLDAFSGSGAVAYLFKTMDKKVITNDFLHFPFIISKAIIENNSVQLDSNDIKVLLAKNTNRSDFIFSTYKDIFFSYDDLRFLDNISANISLLDCEYKKAIALSALIRSCAKKQPRGVFTISSAVSKYNDGRRDLKLSIKEHFIEQYQVYNNAVFNNHKRNSAINDDVFNIKLDKIKPDLVYLDPPYVPTSDDNCYIKRYHFLEGLSKYWQDEKIMMNTKVRKIEKKYTPFSYRHSAKDAFDHMFSKFSNSIIVLSYSSNGYPTLNELVDIMKIYKASISIKTKSHRYNFGNHENVKRSIVDEYLIIGE